MARLQVVGGLLHQLAAARTLRSMDILNMLAELRAHAAALDELIEAAERFAMGGGRRRGRPPKWMQKRRGRPPGSKNKRAAESAAARP